MGDRREVMSKVTLYLMRHGQTIINKAERVQGWCDGVLTEEGIEVAENVAYALRDIEFKAVYSSDLGRAIKTARIVLKENISSENVELIELPELREVYFGKYEGEKEIIMMNDILKHLNLKSFDEIFKFSDSGRAFTDSCAALDETKKAENYDQVIERIMKAINLICTKVEGNGGGNVLVVVHGGILMNLLENLDNNLELTGIDNSSISLVEYEDGIFNVVSVNDLSYYNKGLEIRNKL